MLPKMPTYNSPKYEPKDGIGFIPSYNGSLGYYSNTEYWWNPFSQNGMGLPTTILVRNTVLYLMPFFCGVEAKINKMSVNVTTSRASNTTRVGIYTNSREPFVWYPDKLIYGSSALASSSNGVKTETITQTNLVLEQNMLYWMAVANGGGTANPAYRGIAVGGFSNLFGLDTAMGTSAFGMLEASFTYGALPDTAPAGAIISTVTTIPYVAMQVNLLGRTFEGNLKP